MDVGSPILDVFPRSFEDPLLTPLKKDQRDLSELSIQLMEEGLDKRERKEDKHFLNRCIDVLFNSDAQEASAGVDMKRAAEVLKKSNRRLDFAFILNQQRTKKMCVPSENFDLFCDLLEIALKETERSGDFKDPTAKVLMNMTATYYRKVGDILEFAQNRLKFLSIWRNFEFWAEILCGTIRRECETIATASQFVEFDEEQKGEFVECERNIAFATVNAFIHSMLSLNVPPEDVFSFVHKWSMFYSLPAEQTQVLKQNVSTISESLRKADRENQKKMRKTTLHLQKKSPLLKERERRPSRVELPELPFEVEVELKDISVEETPVGTSPQVHDQSFLREWKHLKEEQQRTLGQKERWDRELKLQKERKERQQEEGQVYPRRPSRVVGFFRGVSNPGEAAGEDILQALQVDTSLERNQTDALNDSLNDSAEDINWEIQWMDDEEAIYCPICVKEFHPLTRRKHHCRRCGRIFCGKCSSKRIPLPYSPNKDHRVCDICFVQVSLINQ